MNEKLEKAVNSGEITKKEALEFYSLETGELFFAASKLRKKYHGKKVKICSIINAKSGQCGENCKFCAQSAFNKTEVDVYPLVSVEKIASAADKALENAQCFGIVSSGNYLNEQEIDLLCGMFKKHQKIENLSVSIGRLTSDVLVKLKEAGITKIHHNLETSENFFHNICSTHTYGERVDNIKRAKALGFTICSGGLFGIGESIEDRIDLAFTLKELGVESVPMNFFIPVPGTPLENIIKLSPNEILKTISIFRLILQQQDIVVCGGREVNLRDLQAMVFLAGANGMMSGGYLTTGGRAVREDMQMIEDLGLEIG